MYKSDNSNTVTIGLIYNKADTVKLNYNRGSFNFVFLVDIVLRREEKRRNLCFRKTIIRLNSLISETQRYESLNGVYSLQRKISSLTNNYCNDTNCKTNFYTKKTYPFLKPINTKGEE